MATLEIAGRRVEVDDAFRNLSPEDQQKAVNEIAGKISAQQPPMDAETTPHWQSMAAGGGLGPEGMGAGMAELSQITQDLGARQSQDPTAGDDFIRANMEARKIDAWKNPGAFRDSADSVDPLMGWGDELYSSTVGAGARMMRDGVGYGDARRREQYLQDALKRNREERSPVASTIGSVAGGLATGGMLGKGGMTLMGKSLPVIGRTGAAMLEGGAYGAAQGSGDAEFGDKLAGAGRGAAIGAVTAGAMSKAGDMIANRAASKAASKMAPAADELKAASGAIYDTAYQSGTVIKPFGTNKLIDNMTLVAGRPNVNSRPETFGLLDDLKAMKGKALDVEAFHELRKQVDGALKGAKPEDARILMKMKGVLDGSENWMTANHVTNGANGLKLLKEANTLYARGMKTGKLETMLDLADVKSARYTQSGMANALRDKASLLYGKIKSGAERGFSAEEVAIIRDLAKGKHSGPVKTWLAKFAPRGPVSAGIGGGLGGTVGTMIGGPVGGAIGMAVPGSVGYVAGRSVDKAATRMALGLRDLAARGGVKALPPALSRVTRAAIPSSIAATGLLSQRRRSELRQAR